MRAAVTAFKDEPLELSVEQSSSHAAMLREKGGYNSSRISHSFKSSGRLSKLVNALGAV